MTCFRIRQPAGGGEIYWWGYLVGREPGAGPADGAGATEMSDCCWQARERNTQKHSQTSFPPISTLAETGPRDGAWGGRVHIVFSVPDS